MDFHAVTLSYVIEAAEPQTAGTHERYHFALAEAGTPLILTRFQPGEPSALVPLQPFQRFPGAQVPIKNR